MPSFEDVTPTVLQSSVPQESRANMKNKVLEIISFLLLWVQLLFSQKLEAGASAHLAVWTWLTSTAGCEENLEWGGPSPSPLTGELHSQGKSVSTPVGRHHICSCYHIHTNSWYVCVHINTSAHQKTKQKNINSWTSAKHSSRKNGKQ